jgi:hypothetical protein
VRVAVERSGGDHDHLRLRGVASDAAAYGTDVGHLLAAQGWACGSGGRVGGTRCIPGDAAPEEQPGTAVRR